MFAVASEQADLSPSLRRVSGPTEEPVTLEDARRQCRVDGTDEDSVLSSMLSAARETLEADTERVYGTQQWALTLDGFPCEVELAMCPVLSVDSVKYREASAGTLTTLDPSVYVLESQGEPARIRRAYGQVWPIVRCGYPGAVTVTFTAGYAGGDDGEPVPEIARQAILLLVGHWYANREAAADRSVRGVELTYEALSRRLRWRA